VLLETISIPFQKPSTSCSPVNIIPSDAVPIAIRAPSVWIESPKLSLKAMMTPGSIVKVADINKFDVTK